MDWEEIFAKHVSEEELISTIDTDLSKHTVNKQSN